MQQNNKKIKFLDLAAAYSELKADLDATIINVAQSGSYLLGNRLSEFEREFADYVEAKHCIGVSNGLDALRLALLSVGIRPGDEVIVPAHTFIATWLAVSQVGAIPVPVEPEWLTMNIDPLLIERSITNKTKAILVTHLYGLPADLDLIASIAKKYNICLIEDAAQAQGAEYKGTKIGAHSDIVCWSFYPGKNLGALGDAGGVTTNSKEYEEKIRILRNYGSLKKYEHINIGLNCRLDEIQAAILSIKLSKLDEWNLRRKKLATIYMNKLADLPLVLPCEPQDRVSAWHLFVIRTPLRNKLYQYLLESGCDVIIHYPKPPHDQECYRNLEIKNNLIITERLSREVLSLPISPHHSEEEIHNVCDLIQNFFDKK
jgi:dTDP-4-amino-4,6-dideoxygalactose transaminase